MSDPAEVETEQQIFDRLDADPANAVVTEGFNEGPRQLTATERIEALWLRAKTIRQQQLRDATEAPKRTLRDQLRVSQVQIANRRLKLDVKPADILAFQNLPTWGTATAAQKQEILRHSADESLQNLAITIRVLIDRGLIEGA